MKTFKQYLQEQGDIFGDLSSNPNWMQNILMSNPVTGTFAKEIKEKGLDATVDKPRMVRCPECCSELEPAFDHMFSPKMGVYKCPQCNKEVKRMQGYMGYLKCLKAKK